MTPRELAGWVPAERHVYFDVDGNETGYAVIERESRVSDDDRNELLALALYEADVCGGCGTPTLVAEDEDLTVQPGTRTCRVCAAAAGMSRILAEADEQWAKEHKGAASKTPRPADGRHLTMRFLTPSQAAAERDKLTKGGTGDHTA